MVPGRTLTLGDDDLVTCLARFIHTSALIMEKYPSELPTTRSTKLKVLSLESKIEIQCLQECVVFLSPISPDVELQLV